MGKQLMSAVASAGERAEIRELLRAPVGQDVYYIVAQTSEIEECLSLYK